MNESLTCRACRPHTSVFDQGDTHWRGGVVQSIVGDTATLRVLAEHHAVRTFSGPLDAVPEGARAIGEPLVVRLTGSGLANYQIAEIRPSHFNRGDGVPSDQAGAVARGEFYYAVVPRAITGASEFYDW